MEHIPLSGKLWRNVLPCFKLVILQTLLSEAEGGVFPSEDGTVNVYADFVVLTQIDGLGDCCSLSEH